MAPTLHWVIKVRYPTRIGLIDERNGCIIKSITDAHVRVDDVNSFLDQLFLDEANTALDRLISDIASRSDQDIEDVRLELLVTPLACLKTFLSDCLLEKLRYVANRSLHERRKKNTTKNELLGLVVLHVLSASYNQCPKVICDPTEGDHFFQLGISSERYYEVWSSLSGSKETGAAHDYTSTGWCRTANRATSMITEIESETASINRDLLYIRGSTVFSLDDDHLRMASRSVVNLTYLRQRNNPKKGLGPVGNALCYALNPFFYACHFTRTGEKLLHTWERLVQLVKGVSTTGALRPMPDAIFAADRGYNSKETIAFLSDTLGASLLGTHKRDLWYPFVFGDRPISWRHQGIKVSERGCRAVYTASLKEGGVRGSQIRRAEPCVYRESCSGRIAALVHNNPTLFPSRCFTTVLLDTFRCAGSVQKLEESLVNYYERFSRSVVVRLETTNTGEKKVDQLLGRCRILTYYQSEDPVWFLLRAFRFTSRTAHGFFAATARDYEQYLIGLSWLLRGKLVGSGTEQLPQDISAREQIQPKWENVMNTLGLMMGVLPRPSSRRTVAERLQSISPSRISATTKPELQAMLTLFGRGLEARTAKAQFVAAVIQLKADICASRVSVDGPSDDITLTAEQQNLEAAGRISHALREASLNAWVMKPLFATAGMKEGSRNEVEIIKALPKFFEDNPGAYRRPFGSSTYKWNDTFQFKVRHVRSTGLIESERFTMLADSADGVMACADEDDFTAVYAVEIRTMTSVRTIEAASILREKYGAIHALQNVGSEEHSSELFRELVPCTEYRAQVLHHSATLGINNVVFVAGTEGSMVEGGILYAWVINFSELLRHDYT